MPDKPANRSAGAPSGGPDHGAKQSSAKQSSAKQAAAQARLDSEAAERKRERTIRIVGGVVVLLIVGVLLAVGFFTGRAKNEAAAGPQPDPAAASPAGVDPATFGVPYGTAWTSANEAKLPTLELWEDFQCPACGKLEKDSGAGIAALAEAGKVKLLYRPAIFLDAKLPKSSNSSARAAGAWGCAIDAGKIKEYHSGVFAMQPTTEGEGYTDQQLLDLATQVGIEGDALTTFTACFDKDTYLPWSANSNQKFVESGVGGTPSGVLNGTVLDPAVLADVDQLSSAIEAATAK